MKMVWKKKENDDRGKKRTRPVVGRNLPFDAAEETEAEPAPATELQDSEQNSSPAGALAHPDRLSPNPEKLAESFRSQGDQLAEEGKYREALGKWEAALMLTPDKAVLHEQKAQILLELGDAWNALKAASRATQLEPSWAEGWVTLARAQLNFGEPEASIESLDMALAIKPDSEDAQVDRQIALNLVKKRKQLRLSGSGASEGRFVVRGEDEHEECRPPLHTGNNHGGQ